MESRNLYDNLIYDWWKNLDKLIFFLFLSLIILGMFFSLVSTSLIASTKLGTNNYYFFIRHLIYIFLGFCLIIFFSALKEKDIYKISILMFILFFISLILIPFFGVEIKGSKRWLDFPTLPRFQPIEFVKPFLIILISLILSNEKYNNVYLKYLFSFLLTLLIALLLAAQPDIGQTLLIFFTWSVLIFISGINIIFLITSSLIIIMMMYLSINFIPKFAYIKSRILSFFNTETGTHNAQSEKAIDSITSGGFFGKGIGEGTLKNRVPEAHTDYIISVISEEFGVIAIILILSLFLIFIHSVFKKVYLEQDERTKLILVGCISLILVQAMIHIGVNIRLFPTTGMTLPFISYGGSSIISISILSGIILNLTKRKIK